MKKVVLSLSGGLDSTTLLGYFIEQGFQVVVVNFEYPSKHNSFERKAFEKIIDYYKGKTSDLIGVKRINVNGVFESFNSALLLNDQKIPEGHYQEKVMEQTVVPARNMIFASILVGIADSIGFRKIALGVHAGDHFIYPDCRPEFLKAFDVASYLATDKKVEVLAPFSNINKAGIIALGMDFKIKVPFELTRTCYKAQALACGVCGSCVERKEAFEKNNLIDLIGYEK